MANLPSGAGHAVPFLWSRTAGLRSFGLADNRPGLASAVSNGGVLCGSLGKPWAAAIWTAPDVSESIAPQKPQSIAPRYSHAVDITSDGSVAVGRCWANKRHWEAFRWADGETSFLPTSPDHKHAQAKAITPSGDLILGVVFNTTRYHGRDYAKDMRPVLWKNQSLQFIDGFDPSENWRPADISADGQVIVGARWTRRDHDASSDQAFHWEAFRWEAGRVTLLGTLPLYQQSAAMAVSGDGCLIVGCCFDRRADEASYVGFVWDAQHGMRLLAEYLARKGSNPAGWQIQTGTGLSNDGNTMSGYGLNPNRKRAAWLARLPAAK